MRKSKGFEGELIIEVPGVAIRACQEIPLIKSLFISRMGYYPQALHHYYKRPYGLSQVVLIYCTNGKGWIQIEDEEMKIRPGDVFALPRNTPHSYGADEKNPWSIYWFHLLGNNCDEVSKSITGGQRGSYHPLQVGFTEERNNLFKQIASTFLKGYSTANLLFANLTLSYYLGTLIYPEQLQSKALINQTANAIDKAITYMQQHLCISVTLEDIAQSANLSVSFFSRKFKQETGYAPIEYFNHLRIQKACQLLHFSDLRINEVSSQIGIDDPFYFSRLFKQQMGLSPANYRKNKGTDTG